MSVSILNITGNISRFEDRFVNSLVGELRTKMGSGDVKLTTARGDDLMHLDNVLAGHHVVVVVSHGGSDDNDTTLDTGLQEGLLQPGEEQNHNLLRQAAEVGKQLMSPEVLTQLLGKNSVNYVLLFCACNSLSPGSIASIDDTRCIGTVTSETLVHSGQADMVTDLIIRLHNLVMQGEVNGEGYHQLVETWKRCHCDPPGFRFFPHIYVETD